MNIKQFSYLLKRHLGVVNSYDYLNTISKLWSSLSTLRNQTKQTSITPQLNLQINNSKQQFNTNKTQLLGIISKITVEHPEIINFTIEGKPLFEKYLSPQLVNILESINEGNIDAYFTELQAIYTSYTQLNQLNPILSNLEIPSEEFDFEEKDILNITFDGGVSVNSLKDLIKESTVWNQHVQCFSRLARQNNTDTYINSIERGSLLLSVSLAAGTIIAVTKAIDKVQDLILKSYEVRKKTLELKQIKAEYIAEVIELLEKKSKINLNDESEKIVTELLNEFNWTENEELFHETKVAVKSAVKKIIKFLNSGGKVESYLKESDNSENKKTLNAVKSKNKQIEEIDDEIKRLSDSKQILLLDEGEENENNLEEQ